MIDDPRKRDARRLPFAICLVWIVAMGLLYALYWSHLEAGRFPDPDDPLRLVQVRDLIAGQGWFDLHQYRIDPPAGTLMHWSRLVDAPLALLVMALAPLLGMEQAELAAAMVVGPIMMLAIMQIVGRLAWRLFDMPTAVFACLVLALSPGLAVQLQPYRVDHHAWQVLCAAIALWAISWRRVGRGAGVAGVAIGTGLMISLEVLPIAAGFAAVLGLRWLRDHRERWWLSVYMQALALSMIVLFVATRDISEITTFCDAIMLPHLGFFVIAALGTRIIASQGPLPLPALAAAFLLVAMMGAGFVGLSGPQCLTEPFGTLDPIVRDNWYMRVLEGMPIWHQQSILVIALGVPQIVIAVLVCLWAWSTHRDWLRRWWFEQGFLLLVGILAMTATTRSVYFAVLFSAIPTAWLAARLLHRFRLGVNAMRRLAAVAVLAVVLFPSQAILAGAGAFGGLAPSNNGNAGNAFASSNCDLTQSARRLRALPPATLFAPLDIGPDILFHTRHSVVATGHHRANAAMRDVIVGFSSTPAEARQIIARHGALYVVVCVDLKEASDLGALGGSDGLMSRLEASRPPAWLEAVDLGTPPEFRVWRVAGPQRPVTPGGSPAPRR